MILLECTSISKLLCYDTEKKKLFKICNKKLHLFCGIVVFFHISSLSVLYCSLRATIIALRAASEMGDESKVLLPAETLSSKTTAHLHNGHLYDCCGHKSLTTPNMNFLNNILKGFLKSNLTTATGAES